MESTYKMKGVIFSRSWWSAAVQELNPEDRLQFYDAVMLYAFTDEIPGSLSAAVRPMLAMVKPFIDEDRVKYQERVERNRQNARGHKPVAASGSQSLPVAHNTNTNTITNINTNTNTISLSEEREKWLVFGYLWSSGSGAVEQEFDAFWSYYESLGWKNNKGAAIVNKLAAARMWRRQFETKQAPDGAAAWFNAMRGCPVLDYDVFRAFMGAELIEDRLIIRLHVSDAWMDDFKGQCSGLLLAFQKACRASELRLERV